MAFLCKVPVIVSCLNFIDRFSKISEISNFINIHPVGVELQYENRWRGRRAGGKAGRQA
jgi:hypothetical protein